MDLTKQQVCDQQRLALKRWDELNDMLARGEQVDQMEYTNLRVKILNLDYQLELLSRDVA